MKSGVGAVFAAVAGTVAIAVCCFTPILAIALGAIGAGAMTRYFDYVLIPALIGLVLVMWRADYFFCRSGDAGSAAGSEGSLRTSMSV